MKAKSIMKEFAPRNATMKYAIADVAQRIKLQKHIAEIAEQLKAAESIHSMIEYCDISDTRTHTAMKDNIARLGGILEEVETYLLVLSQYGFCSPIERKNAFEERSECIKEGKCNGECKTCNEGWSFVGECRCNITGSDGYKKNIAITQEV